MAQIKTTSHNGIHFIFDNGWTASVQWGYGNYCDNYNKPEAKNQSIPSTTVEIACWPKDGDLTDIWDNGDTVDGHISIEDIPAFLQQVKEMK